MKYDKEYIRKMFGRMIDDKYCYYARGEVVFRDVFSYEFNPNSRVLEFGCGIGQNLVKIKNKYGYDINKTIYPFLKEQGFILYNSEEEIPDDYFDEILVHNVLEHLPNPLETLKILRTKLKRNGKIRVLVPRLSYNHKIRDWKSDINDTIDRHYYGWTHYELNYLLNQAGFENLVNEFVYRKGYERLIWFYKWLGFSIYYFLVKLSGRVKGHFDLMVISKKNKENF